jgi:hypothetical protein
MAESTTPTLRAVAAWLMFIVSFDMLIILFIVVPYRCGRMFIDSGGEYVCDLGTGWYIFSAVFSILAIYFGYWFYKTHEILIALFSRITGRGKNRSPPVSRE